MRILYLTGEFPPMRGSVGDHTARLASAVGARGHMVGVLTSTRARGAALDDVAIHPIVERWDARAWPAIARVAARYDLLHLEYQAGAFGMGVAPQFLPDALRLLTGGKPFVTTFHDLLVPYLFPKAGRLRAWSVRHLARASDGVIATNPEDAATLRGWGVRALREIPIAAPLPLEPAPDWDRAAWRARWNVEPHHKLVVHYGFLTRAKGVETLLHAHDGLLRAGQPVRVLMAGDPLGASDATTAAYLAEIEALAEALNLTPPWLQWTGDLPEQELVHALLAADLVALPFREGASLRRSTLVMALSLGRPVLTTEPQTPIPLLRADQTIALARRDDPADFARQMALLLRYEPKRQRIERAAAEVGQQFDWSTIAAQTVELYQALVGGAR